MERSFETVLIERCAPTLAGVKPASLFRYRAKDSHALRPTVAPWTEILARHGLTLRLMRECPRTGSLLFYLYREGWVARIVSREESRRFLERMGYPPRAPLDDLLLGLSARICPEEAFPHEIGLFLGYPLCDVIGFMEHKGRNYTHSGPWKAYGDAAEAQKRFAMLKKCSAVYKRKYESGTPISRLIVAA